MTTFLEEILPLELSSDPYSSISELSEWNSVSEVK